MMPVAWCRPEELLAHLGVEGPDAEVEDDGQERSTTARVAEREEEADAERSLALVDQLAGRVVDGRDVIGVEGVAHAQGVGEHPGPEAEEPGLGHVVVVPAAGDSRPQPMTLRLMMTSTMPPIRSHSLGVSAFCSLTNGDGEIVPVGRRIGHEHLPHGP